MPKRITIKDIAQHLGISKSTVSRALADRYDVNPATREAVLAMAEKLHYRPNVTAINFMSQNTKIIGVVVPEFLNSFFPRIIIEIQRFFEKHGYNVLITQSNESAEEERKNLQMMENAMVEGMIISVVHRNRNLDYYERLREEGMPLVFMNRTSDLPDTTQVVINENKMATAAVEHLLAADRRRILHLSGPSALKKTPERLGGYRQAFENYGVPVNPNFIVEGGLTRDSGYRAMRDFLASGLVPDAVFGFNDPVAIGAMMAIRRHGKYRIPQDIAMVGFSESRSALLVDPPLTSVEQPLGKLGYTAAKLLLEKIENPDAPAMTVVLDAKLNIRESSDESADSFPE